VDEDFEWAPGGNELVLATSDGQRSQIVALDAATGAQRVLVREDVNVSGPSLSPDGAQLAYYRCCTAYNLPLIVRNLATGTTTEIGRGLGAVRWSPDGMMVALLGDRRVDRVAMVRRVDGTGEGASWSGRDPLWLP
jgi:Tol biopolymer transport system component